MRLFQQRDDLIADNHRKRYALVEHYVVYGSSLFCNTNARLSSAGHSSCKYRLYMPYFINSLGCWSCVVVDKGRKQHLLLCPVNVSDTVLKEIGDHVNERIVDENQNNLDWTCTVYTTLQNFACDTFEKLECITAERSVEVLYVLMYYAVFNCPIVFNDASTTCKLATIQCYASRGSLPF
jgi:hypothetical protein